MCVCGFVGVAASLWLRRARRFADATTPHGRRYWVSVSSDATVKALKDAIEEVAYAHGVAFTCSTLCDESGCFLADNLGVAALLGDRSTVRASASTLVAHHGAQPAGSNAEGSRAAFRA